MNNTIFDRNKTVALLAILIILMLGLILRTWNLYSNPPALFADELVNFCGIRSVMETGKDLDGKNLFYLSDRVELRTPLYGTLAYFSTRFFGENSFGIRFPAAFMGTLTILLLYAFVLELTKNQLPALFTAFCLAILPWHIHLSRIGWEPAALLCFLLSALLFFTIGIKRDKKIILLAGFAFFSLTIYTYAGAPLYAFLFLVFLIIAHYRYFFKNPFYLFGGCLLSALLAVPYIIVALTQPALLERARRISTFAAGFNWKTLTLFFKNYLAHFNLEYLFIKGDGNPRLSAFHGVLYWWMLPLILTGLAGLWKFVRPRLFFWLILFWLIIYPLGGSLTTDGVPHSNRTLPGAPLFALFAGMGMFYVIYLLEDIVDRIRHFKWLKESGAAVIILVTGFSAIPFINHYFRIYPVVSSNFWNDRQDQVFSTVKAIEQNYKNVFLGNLDYWIEIPMLAYYYPDRKLHYIDEDTPYNWYNVSGTICVLTSDMRRPDRYKLIRTVYDIFGEPLYYILVIDGEHLQK